jgi:hypothetical protein
MVLGIIASDGKKCRWSSSMKVWKSRWRSTLVYWRRNRGRGWREIALRVISYFNKMALRRTHLVQLRHGWNRTKSPFGWRKCGLRRAQILTLWTILCGASLSPRPVELGTPMSTSWSPPSAKRGTPCLCTKKTCRSFRGRLEAVIEKMVVWLNKHLS